MIIGSNGFVGKNLSGYLKKFFNIYTINRNPLIENLKNVKCDIVKNNFLKSKIAKLPKFKYVINLSGQLENSRSKMYNNIFIGNKNIINCFKNEKTKLIFFSTTLVYGHSADIKTIKSNPKPMSDYAKIKEKTEKLYKKKSNNFVIVRLANVYDDKLKKKGLIKNLIDAIKNNKIIKINKMNSIKNYIHASDMNKIIYLILSKNSTRYTINVVHENISNVKMINLFEKIFKKSIKFKNLKKGFADDPSIKLKLDLLFKKIKFKFDHTIESTLKKIYEK